jgi:hypothetical protein
MSTQTDTASPQTTGPGRPRSRRQVLAVCAAVAAAVAALVVATTVNVGSISLVDGWFPVALFWVTVAVDLWAQAFSDSPPWLSWPLKLTPEPRSVPARCVPGQS